MILQGDVYTIECPYCSGTKGLVQTPFAENLKCLRCGSWISRTHVKYQDSDIDFDFVSDTTEPDD